MMMCSKIKSTNLRVIDFFRACYYNNLEFLENNCTRKEIFDLEDEKKNTLLHEAVKSGCENVVKFLVKNGSNVNAQNFIGNTPLHEACAFNRVSICKILIDFGARTNIPNNGGTTPLNVACKYQNKIIAKFLVEKGGTLKPEHDDNSYKSKNIPNAFYMVSNKVNNFLSELIKNL